jgi:hypothetical protein
MMTDAATIGALCTDSPQLEQQALSISRLVEIDEREMRILSRPVSYRITQDPRDGLFGTEMEYSTKADFEVCLPLADLFDFLDMEPLDCGAHAAPELRLRTMLTNIARVHPVLGSFDDRRWRDLHWYARGRAAQYTAGFTAERHGC